MLIFTFSRVVVLFSLELSRRQFSVTVWEFISSPESCKVKLSALKMPFMKGRAPIRRTIEYLTSGNLVLKEQIKVVSINYNTFGSHHDGARLECYSPISPGLFTKPCPIAPQRLCLLEPAQVAVQKPRSAGGHLQEHDAFSVYSVLLW